MTREINRLSDDLRTIAKFADRGELEDLPAATYRNLRTATNSVLRWHDRNYASPVSWGVVLLLFGGVVVSLAIGLGLS